jgi:hypothetical protein
MSQISAGKTLEFISTLSGMRNGDYLLEAVTRLYIRKRAKGMADNLPYN